MRKIIYLLVVSGLLLLSHCGNMKDEYKVDTCFSKEQQVELLQEMVRYTSKLPPEATDETKFNPEFNWYYEKAVAECRIMFCQKNSQDSSYQLLVARKARSITPMEEGIALKIKFGEHDKFAYYNEVFRTWKMPADTLNKRGKFLFETMIQGRDLSLYYSKFQKDRYIEFPDERFTFDVEARKWRDKELDTLNIN